MQAGSRGTRRTTFPFGEEVPVTLHVALVGRDGIVLAGDRELFTPEDYATGSLSSKIKIDFTRGIAVAWARDEIAETIANEMLNHTEILEDDPELLKLAETTYRKKRRDWSKPDLEASLLAVSQKHLGKIFWIEVRKSHCFVRPVYDKRFIGHVQNSACFLTERYYEKGLSVSELTSLGAHTILAAGDFNRLGINGLEIVVCKENGIIRVPDSEITLLEQQEETNSSEFRRLLLGREQGSPRVHRD